MALTASAGTDSKSGLIIVIVLALHVGAYYIIESGLSQAIIEMVAKPVETVIIEEDIVPEDLPPPPPPPDIVEPPPFIPPPEVSVAIQMQTNAIQTVTNERPPEVVPPKPAPPAPVVAGTAAKWDPKKSRNPDDYYPAASNRADEVGKVQIRCFAQLNGRCTEASVVKSSGYERLDEAAVKYALEGLRVTPGTENGVPVAKWFELLVSFKQKRD